jgi:hypothetical protein
MNAMRRSAGQYSTQHGSGAAAFRKLMRHRAWTTFTCSSTRGIFTVPVVDDDTRRRYLERAYNTLARGSPRYVPNSMEASFMSCAIGMRCGHIASAAA